MDRCLSGPSPRPGALANRAAFFLLHTTNTSDATFETAHKPSTKTNDFHTSAEELSDDDDEGAATEIESPAKGATLRASRRPPPLSLSFQDSARAARMSFQSTASTSDDEQDGDLAAHADLTTPNLERPENQRDGENGAQARRRGVQRLARGKQNGEMRAKARCPGSFLFT